MKNERMLNAGEDKAWWGKVFALELFVDGQQGSSGLTPSYNKEKMWRDMVFLFMYFF
jgi:hypothetical protein